jgi:hypothetical protein
MTPFVGQEEQSMKHVKISAVVVVAACGLMFSRSAHAFPNEPTVNATWTFNDLVGNCDSTNLQPIFGAKACFADMLWFTGGRAGYNTVNGNGFLWISNDQSWNSWNIGLNPNSVSGSVGHCTVQALVFSTDPSSSTIGEMDVWEDNGGGNLTFIGSHPINGTGGVWTQTLAEPFDISRAVVDNHNVLFVFGRHQGEGKQEFIAIDNVTIFCTIG